MLSAFEAIKFVDRCELLRSFIVFIKETFEQLNKYSSRRTSGEYIAKANLVRSDMD